MIPPRIPDATAQEAKTSGSSAYSVLYNLANTGPQGAFPYSGVISDSRGDLYGTTSSGGLGYGVVYKVNRGGRQTPLYLFTGGIDGNFPEGSLAADAAGNVYGATQVGGPANAGVIFKVTRTGMETVLYGFTGGADGNAPLGGVTRDPAGNLYGTTLFGGTVGAGVVFKVDPIGHETVLYNFTGGADGGYPGSSLILDSAGNVYGTAGGGTAGLGVVFKLDPSGQETVLYNSSGGADGGLPQNVILDSSGNLYGTTLFGGDLNACYGGGCGVVFKLDPSGNETVLYAFTGLADGANPAAGLAHDAAGNLYGATGSGGDMSLCYTNGCGVVFKVDTYGNETVLHTFTSGADGASPLAGVIRDAAGNLYGTTSNGGQSTLGVVYELDTLNRETLLYTFPGSTSGTAPFDGVVRDSTGSLYGTTYFGGAAGQGVVYKVNPGGHEKVLHSFTGGADGGGPNPVILDSAGNLYGTTSAGGSANAGVVFKMTATGEETVLYTFTGGADGAGPIGNLAMDSAGNLYGEAGGGDCILFKLNPAGHETVLHTFTGFCFLDGGVALDSAGNVYGTSIFGDSPILPPAGFVFKVDPYGNETVLHNFVCGPDDGCQPHAGVTLDAAGNVYGTTFFGGPVDAGVVYKIDPSGNETVLHSFAGGYAGRVADGGNPYAGVTLDAAGNLYGTTSAGGLARFGIAYKLDTSGNETVLHSFTGGADGGSPSGRLIFDPAGNLYGTAPFGGLEGGGVIFRIFKE